MHRSHWIFDMDGTLTVSVHDFPAISAELGLPPGRPILESLRELPSAQARNLEQRLQRIEEDLAGAATAQRGAAALLAALSAAGVALGILTRNSHANALRTLAAADLARFFEPRYVLGREACEPKPRPDGIHKLLAMWGAPPEHCVMVGDYLFDMQAGRDAGLATVYFDPTAAFEWAGHADHCVSRLEAILDLPLARGVRAGGPASQLD